MNGTTERLRRILERAATVPGNRDRFQAAGLLRPDSPHLVTDWQQPFLTLRPLDRETMRNNPGAFLASADIVYRGITSGSQGTPLVYFADADWNRMRIAARRRSLSWWGIGDRTPILNVASRLFPVREVDGAIAGSITPEWLNRLLVLMAAQPLVLRGYPSRLCEVAAVLKGGMIPAAIAVIATGECLFDYQRTLLEQVFRAPVINEYGSQEAGVSGMTCPEAGRLHLDSDRCLYEVIDGQLITTDLWNQVMPMVRYRGGDRLYLEDTPCPCGRSGITARFLGRTDQPIRTLMGHRYAGEIPMPAFPGILSYQVLRGTGTEVVVRVRPNGEERPSLQPLADWAQTLFGTITVQVWLDTDLPEEEEREDEPWDAHTWIRAVTQQSWATWLNQPTLPSGSVRLTAQLLRELIQPGVVLNTGMPPMTQALLDACLHQGPDPDPTIAQITARVLLFACCFLVDEPVQAARVYHQAVGRWKQAIAFTHPSTPPPLDLLIPSLYLETPPLAWMDDFPQYSQPDRFTIHHLLWALEAGAKGAIAHRTSPIHPAIRPLQSLLIGDLSFFAPHLGTWLLAHWYELLQGKPAPFVASQPVDSFCQCWWQWRQQMIGSDLEQLQQAARSPQEHARVQLERGYALLLNDRPLDPQEWLPILQTAMGTASDTPEQPGDPVAWAPLLRVLAQPLLNQGRSDLAYACLVAATAPSSQATAFERLATEVNNKQVMIGDRCPGKGFAGK